jgi:integrase
MRGRTVRIAKNSDPRRAKPWQVKYRDGNGRRRCCFFATEAEARTYRDARQTELVNFGARALSLPDSIRHEAQRSMELLAPHDKTLLEAVRFYIGYLERTKRSLPIEELISKFLWAKQTQGVSPRHQYDLTSRLKRLASAFPARIVNTFETDELSDWLLGLRLAQQSKRNYQRVLHSFFAYAARRKYADANPMSAMPNIKVPDQDVVVYTPEEISRLLINADPFIVPYLALGAFAGIRRAELLRLKWEDIRFSVNTIFMSAHITKTASKRSIEIADNLKEWILPLAQKQGNVVTDAWRLRILIGEACEKAGVPWKHNGLRHSFGTYRLAQTQDVGKASLEMGNSPSVLFKHYRQLVTADQAATYWSVRPESQPNIISITSVAA